MAEDQRSDKKGVGPETAFAVASRHDGGQVIVELRGDLDVDASERLTAELDKLMASTLDRVVIDASDLTFVDSAGLNALVVASEDAQAKGITFEVIKVPSLVRRVIEIGGLGAVLLPDHPA